MLTKINRILIPVVVACLLFILSLHTSASPMLTYNSYLPIVSHNESRWIGPYGGYIVSMAINPSNPQVVYAGTWGSGMFKSQNGGQSWRATNSGLGNLYINSLAIDPHQPSTLYAGTYKIQVFKSSDGGNTWKWSGSGMQAQAIVYAIAIDPLAPATLYAGTRGISNNGNPPWKGVVYKSVNAGQTWAAVLENVGSEDAQDWVYSLAIDPNHNYSVYAATHEHGPFHSSNYGSDWYSIHDGINDDSGRAILISPDPSEGTTMYYGVWHFDSVYKSLDGGNDWFLANHGIAYTKVYGMAIDPIHTDRLYLATFNRGVLKTLDGGESWQPGGLLLDLTYTLAVDPLTPANLYAGTAGDGLNKSQDGGSSWQHASVGIDNAMPTAVIVSPSDPKRIYTSIYGAGVYQSTNRGTTWSELNAGLGDKFVHALVQNPVQPGLLYALTDTGGLYQNDLNSGTGWVSVSQGLPLTVQPQPAYLADHLSTHEMQEALTLSDQTQSVSQPTSVNLLVMTFALSAPQIAYLETGGSGVYKSTNAGLTWLPAGLGGESVQGLVVDKVNSSLVYAATTTPGSLIISSNGGGSWSDAILPVTFYSLVTSPSSPGILYAGTSDGLYRYQSATWTQLGLDNLVVTALAIDPSHQDRFYAGTTSGAYFTDDGGLSWAILDRNLKDLTIQSIQLYPTQPNWVYFSTKTHGIYMATVRF